MSKIMSGKILRGRVSHLGTWVTIERPLRSYRAWVKSVTRNGNKIRKNLRFEDSTNPGIVYTLSRAILESVHLNVEKRLLEVTFRNLADFVIQT